jgi:molybdate transport system ATP-binding protein
MTTLHVDVGLGGKPERRALDVAFEVPPGVTVLFGPSGAGKTRTLACIAGLVRPDRGRIVLGGTSWFDARLPRRDDLPIHERRVAYVFQSLALFPHMTAAENVAYGLPSSLSRDERRESAIELLARMHVRQLADRRPQTFSGGESQRVALARALAIRPRVVLLDEPFSALDAAVKEALLREIGAVLREQAVPTILVTHHPAEAEILGERVVFLEAGRVKGTADVEEGVFKE